MKSEKGAEVTVDMAIGVGYDAVRDSGWEKDSSFDRTDGEVVKAREVGTNQV